MAFIVMTSTQKEELIGNSNFQREVKWAILDKADYWATHDGTTPPGGIERWRKNKSFAKDLLDSPNVASSPDQVKLFLEYMKNVACVDGTIVPYVVQNTIDKLLATSQFDAAADKWFDGQTARTL